MSREQRFVAYAQAREAVLNAQDNDRARLAAAHEMLRQAETAVRVELDKAWRANVVAIQAARSALRDAIQEQARIETESGNAARTRNPIHPVLNTEEVARCTAASTATDTARQAVLATQTKFKAGVTVEQLEMVT